MTSRTTAILGVIALTATIAGNALGGEITLARNGEADCVIVVPPGSMTWEGDEKKMDHWGRIAGLSATAVEVEVQRRLQRDSVKDLALYLGKMSGPDIEIEEGLPEKDGRTPIYIGAAAQEVFGPVGASLAGKFGFRVVVEDKLIGHGRIGLYGESGYGTSYAIYELLHRLGCRWFMPSELGECIPSLPTLDVPEMDDSLAPATVWRRMETRTADADFRRRNRMNGDPLKAMHALEGYITKEQRDAHPEWCLHVDGKPSGSRLRWTRQDVADAIADAIIARLDENYVPSVSLSPGDGVIPTEDPEERKYDPNPRVWEPAANQWSVTDRLILLANRVAERVGKKYPEVKFGLLAYVNYSMPPAQYKVHPNVVPQLAPIDFNRHHPMTWENHPNDHWLLNMVTGWGAVASNLSYYAYGMNLAEITAPNPFITKWGTDIPIIMKSHFTYWAPETMGGWESMMPGFYLSIRLTFYPDEKPEAILHDLMTRFYGAAAEPMDQYWHFIDHCWVDSNAFAGSAFGYLKMFPPERMAKARELLDDALARCETITEYKRVKMVEESFSNFELFMDMREDWAEAGWWQLNRLHKKLDDWRGSVRHLRRRYRAQYAFDSGLAIPYVDGQFGRAYEDAGRLTTEYTRFGPHPTLEWKYRYDEDKQAEELGWTKPDFDDADWPTTHVVRETWSDIGHHNSMGRMVYRANIPLPALPEGKKAILWIGSTDGSAKLFVNGTHVPYVVPEKTRWNEKGDVIDAFSGYCTPATFDVTSVVKQGINQLTVLCERKWLNELGTGGLMGPVLVVREK